MILPIPELSKKWQQTPVTWSLLALNVVLFLIFFVDTPKTKTGEEAFLERASLQITGQLYFQHLQNVSSEELFRKPEWTHRLRAEDPEQMETLGILALRDRAFLDAADKTQYRGDAVRLGQWREDLQNFRKTYFDDIAFSFGLSSPKMSLNWVTYQFAHAGWMHLLSNMVFMLVMALAIERIAGGAVLIGIYLLGGFAGGEVFFWVQSQGSLSPMIGASASVSALMAFYCLIETRRSIRYAFFMSPLEGQYGVIFLPVLLMVPMFLVTDFASLLSSPQGFGGGVAYAAHIGGTLLGLFAGLLWRFHSREEALGKLN